MVSKQNLSNLVIMTKPITIIENLFLLKRKQKKYQTCVLEGSLTHPFNSQSKLKGKNYYEWEQSIKLDIDGKGRIGYLTGETKDPTLSNSVSHQKWK